MDDLYIVVFLWGESVYEINVADSIENVQKSIDNFQERMLNPPANSTSPLSGRCFAPHASEEEMVKVKVKKRMKSCEEGYGNAECYALTDQETSRYYVNVYKNPKKIQDANSIKFIKSC